LNGVVEWCEILIFDFRNWENGIFVVLVFGFSESGIFAASEEIKPGETLPPRKPWKKPERRSRCVISKTYAKNAGADTEQTRSRHGADPEQTRSRPGAEPERKRVEGCGTSGNP
jgi:hypothetical protein